MPWQLRKWNDEVDNPIKILPNWEMIREYIDKLTDEEIKNALKILYLFGLSIGELAKRDAQDDGLRGTDVTETIVNGEPALTIKIRTSNRGQKKRQVVVPLNSKYEPWSKDILNYCENLSSELVYPNVKRVLEQQIIVNAFRNFVWFAPLYKGKISENTDRVRFTSTNLRDLREWELGLGHNFNQYDFNTFFGKEFNLNYSMYFDKLLRKNDFYLYDDFVKAVELKEAIFVPQHQEQYFIKELMEITKKIKRKYIILTGPFKLNIMKETLAEYKSYKGGRGESFEHEILKKSIAKYLVTNNNSKFENISWELANLDVVDSQNKIIVECGHSNPVKLLDGFNDALEGVKDIKEFWVLQFSDSEGINMCYKFIKNDNLFLKQSVLL
jgi:hypothetical protein